ncbi:MAG: HU family DNA-binding protein [Alphaproteobacteria bacterium GM7ARS4]|nr:HU family DNA-binding protein [Alphaproteobacteria bacterium GM7ARS4]
MKKSLTRAGIAAQLEEKFCMPRKAALSFVYDMFDVMACHLQKGQHVKISSFGTFRILHKKERTGRNPKTQEKAMIAARRVVSLRPSSYLRAHINGEQEHRYKKML